MQSIKFIAVGLLLGLAASAAILLVAAPPGGAPVEILPTPTPSPLTVYVSGAVAKPGRYTLPRGSRVADALTAAGGALVQADLTTLNLAQMLIDGHHVLVPAVGESIPLPTGAARKDAPLDLNSATAEQLEQLPGIGPSKAADIIAYRQKLGGFDTIEQILEVPGIGEAIFERIKDLIAVTPQN